MSVPLLTSIADETSNNKRLGVANSLGVTHTSLGTVATGKVFTANPLHVNNRTGGTVLFSAWIAANSWSSGAPAGGDLVAVLEEAIPIGAYDVVDLGGYVLAAGEKLIVVANTATSLNVSAFGVERPAP